MRAACWRGTAAMQPLAASSASPVNMR
jgi:hypothetical protein